MKKMSTINKLKEKIKTLEKQIESSNKHVYVHRTHQWVTNDGEITIWFGDEQTLTWNIDDLFHCLDDLIQECVTEKRKQDNIKLDQIKNTLKYIIEFE